MLITAPDPMPSPEGDRPAGAPICPARPVPVPGWCRRHEYEPWPRPRPVPAIRSPAPAPSLGWWSGCRDAGRSRRPAFVEGCSCLGASRGGHYWRLGYSVNRSRIRAWISPAPGFTTRGLRASSRPGSAPTRTAWSGCAGRAGSSARPAVMPEAGDWAMAGVSAPPVMGLVGGVATRCRRSAGDGCVRSATWPCPIGSPHAAWSRFRSRWRVRPWRR